MEEQKLSNGSHPASQQTDDSGGSFIKYNFEHNGKKFCVNLPFDAKDIVVGIDFDGHPMIGFKTKFGGKKYLQTYTTVK